MRSRGAAFARRRAGEPVLFFSSRLLAQGLSRAQRRRLCVAIEMLVQPSLVLLDEPTSGRARIGLSRLPSPATAAAAVRRLIGETDAEQRPLAHALHPLPRPRPQAGRLRLPRAREDALKSRKGLSEACRATFAHTVDFPPNRQRRAEASIDGAPHAGVASPDSSLCVASSSFTQSGGGDNPSAER